MNGKNHMKKILGITLVMTLVMTGLVSAMSPSAVLNKPNLSLAGDPNEGCRVDNETNTTRYLVISAPSSVHEGEHFWVYVTDDYQSPIDNALVTFRYYGGQQSGYTNNGSVGFTVPIYNETSPNGTRGTITAEKSGYRSATVEIEIISLEEELLLSAPSSVREGELFRVLVTNGFGMPIDHALVVFMVSDGENGTYENLTYYGYTQNGSICFTAPMVDDTCIAYLEASKDGYLPASTQIIILNVNGSHFKLGDVNNDGWVSWRDIDPFVAAIGTNESQFQAQHPAWVWRAADCNQDGYVSWRDIDPFVALIGS